MANYVENQQSQDNFLSRYDDDLRKRCIGYHDILTSSFKIKKIVKKIIMAVRKSTWEIMLRSNNHEII